MSAGVLDQARREVIRCQRDIDRGGDPAFWIKRIERARKDFDAAATILRMQEAALRSPRGTTPPSGDR